MTLPAILVGLVLLHALAQFLFVLWKLGRADPRHTLASDQNRLRGAGVIFSQERRGNAWTRRHTVEDGIERIVYTPHQRRHETPILMMHGMWHGAWCWETWQELFAEWGWESIAFSLPGHGRSPVQRPIWLCTLDYYLAFLRDEIARLPRRPVLMGHSMGGALTQWYLRHVADDLPAAVLVAPWVADNAFRDGFPLFVRLDPLGILLSSLAWSASPFMRSPRRAFRALLTEGAIFSPQEFHARVGPESALILFQHNPPYWSPPREVRTPMFWVAGRHDAVVSEPGQRRSAEFYGATYRVVEAGHNLMMERDYRQTAAMIHEWLLSVIPA